MSNIIKIAKRPTAPDDIRAQVIAHLKEALAEAEAGNVDEILIIMRHPGDDQWTNLATETQSFAKWIGYLTITSADWIAEFKKARDK